MSSDNSDALSSSFSSSFSLPPPAPKRTQPSQRGAADASTEPQLIIGANENLNQVSAPPPAAQPSSSAAPSGDASDVSNPKETAQAEAAPSEDWKSLLDKNLEAWKAESSVARSKAESTRLKLEEEDAKEKARLQKEKKDAVRMKKEEQEQKEVEELLKLTLEGKNKKKLGKGKDTAQADARWGNVRDAWQIVKDDGEVVTGPSDTPAEELVTDGRDMTDGDEGGRTGLGAANLLKVVNAEVKRVASNSSDPTPASAQRRSDLLGEGASSRTADERREAVSEAWQGAAAADDEKEAPTELPQTDAVWNSVAVETQAMSVPHSSSALVREATEPVPTGISAGGLSMEDVPKDSSRSTEKRQPQPKKSSSPPEQPPSLTLSLFTIPTHRSLLRITAVLGINLVLPFINGVMLGFGEIFARETVGWTKKWWRGEVSWRGPGSLTANVGLRQGARRTDATSGSGGFP